MPFSIPSRKRGRPPKTAAEKLRDRIWIHVVKLRSSLTTGYMLEKTVDTPQVKRQKGMISRPRKWDRYLNWERGPGQIKGKRNSVVLAEAEFPGTACWYHSPIWRALAPKPMTAEECETALIRLDIDVAELLFSIRSDAEHGNVEAHPFDQALADQLVATGSFDALAAAVVMVRWSEAIASPAFRDLALKCYGRLQPAIAKLPEIEPFYEELFSMIDNRCKHWVFIANNQRMDVVIFWEGIRDNVWKDKQ